MPQCVTVIIPAHRIRWNKLSKCCADSGSLPSWRRSAVVCDATDRLSRQKKPRCSVGSSLLPRFIMINFGVAAAAVRSTGQAHISKSCRNGSKSSARVLLARRRDKPQSCQQQGSWQTPPPMQQLIRVLSASIMAAVVLATANGQGPAPSPLISLPSPPPTNLSAVAPQPSPPPALTKSDFETFLDALIPSQLQNRDIAGAVVSVVKDGQVLFAKGYGYADFAAKKPVLADQTLFRPGSISKVFTATAVMQLVEQGKLDLDRDVIDYLDYAISKTYPEPVTLRRILTHTAGFEDTLKNLFVPGAREMRPLRDYLITAMPARIFPPGTVPSYSNYGLTLAGYIVERVSGEPFEKYIAAHILTPLRMDHSSFAQPLPENLAANMSPGYLTAAQGARAFEFVTASPAGALSATATDMTRLMLALLGEGTLEGATILKPESVRAMGARQFELHPALHVLGFIVMDYSMNGQRAVGHGGDTIYFHSDMMLMPDAHIGLFISYNSAGSRPRGGRTEVIRAFFNRYFPEPIRATPAIDLKTAQADRRAVSGIDSGSRRAESTVLQVAAVLGQTSVSSDQNGILTIEGVQSPRGGLKKWREIGPLVYREVDGPDLIAFRRNPNGLVTDMG